jgi:hypothetical protein
MTTKKNFIFIDYFVGGTGGAVYLRDAFGVIRNVQFLNNNSTGSAGMLTVVIKSLR